MRNQLNLFQQNMPFNRLLGYWDKSKNSTTLGSLLIFLEECKLISLLSNTDSIDIAVNASFHGINDVMAGKYRLLNLIDKRDAALSILDSIEEVKNIYLCGDENAFCLLSSGTSNSQIIWPDNDRISYDTTKYIQSISKLTGGVHPIRFKHDLKYWARKSLSEHLDAFPVIGLHLKNLAGYTELSDISLADQNVWYEFLIQAHKRYGVKFLILGDDLVDNKILKIPNVILAKDIGASSFGMHLALLSECSGFMGMMSAISNLAIFSKIPYAIFKNPRHHEVEMIAEIGHENRYPFCSGYQRILRAKETVDSLLGELNLILSASAPHFVLEKRRYIE